LRTCCWGHGHLAVVGASSGNSSAKVRVLSCTCTSDSATLVCARGDHTSSVSRGWRRRPAIVHGYRMCGCPCFGVSQVVNGATAAILPVHCRGQCWRVVCWQQPPAAAGGGRGGGSAGIPFTLASTTTLARHVDGSNDDHETHEGKCAEHKRVVNPAGRYGLRRTLHRALANSSWRRWCWR
jgi:hypothetical protein